jgi:hypothetical protein
VENTKPPCAISAIAKIAAATQFFDLAVTAGMVICLLLRQSQDWAFQLDLA